MEMATFTSAEYAAARGLLATLRADARLAPFVLEGVQDWALQADRIVADAQANNLCIVVQVGEPQAEIAPNPRFTPSAGWLNATLYVWVFARQEYALTPDGARPHETCCGAMDAVLRVLMPAYLNPTRDGVLPAHISAVEEVNTIGEPGFENITTRRLTLLFPIFYK